MIRASDRSQHVCYAIRDVVIPAKKLENKGIEVLHLNIGDPNKYDFDTPEHMKKALYDATLEGYNGYTAAEGELELREEIVKREKRRNKTEYDPSNIVVTTGVTESLQMLLNAMLNPGEELLIPGPTYPQYHLLPNFMGSVPVSYRCIEEEDWQPDVDDIRNKITEKTKALVLINPNNPTGALYSEKVIRQTVDLAGEYGIPIISDEIYDDITFDNPQKATTAIAGDVPVITFNGFSKVYVVPGWRIGYTMFHHDGILDEVEDAFMRITRSRLCSNSVCERACIAALKGPQDHIPEMVGRLKQRRDFAYKRLNEIEGISTAKPDGAFYIFPRIDALESGPWKDDKEFVLDLLHEEHVLTVNGSGFCPEYGGGHFRVVILPTMDVLERSFDKIESFMKKRLA